MKDSRKVKQREYEHEYKKKKEKKAPAVKCCCGNFSMCVIDSFVDTGAKADDPLCNNY